MDHKAGDPEKNDAGGRYNGRTATQLATDAQEAVQGIAHLSDLETPPAAPEDLYRTLSALTRMVEQIPEAVTRISAQLSTWSGAQGLVVSAGPYHGDPDAAISALNEAVDQEVIPALAALRAALVRAQATVNELTLASSKE
jgi:hypothetical protein